jgi:hypothetical protein
MRTELYWTEGPWPSRLAISPRPRGGDWLEEEIRAWRETGVDLVVSLLTQDEIADLDLAAEKQLCQSQGIEFISFPIPDRGVPPSRKAARDLARTLESALREGKNLAIHCRQGIGRAALIAASVFVLSGFDPETTWRRIGIARGCTVPETAAQRQWLGDFARELPAPLSRE